MLDDSRTYFFYSYEYSVEPRYVSFYLFTEGKPIEVFNELLNGKFNIDKYGNSNILFKNNWDIIYKISDKLPLTHFVDLELIRNEFELELIQVEELMATEFKSCISSAPIQSLVESLGDEFKAILNGYLSNNLTLSITLIKIIEFYSRLNKSLEFYWEDLDTEYYKDKAEKSKIPINLNSFINTFNDECDKLWTKISLRLIEKKGNKMLYLNSIITRLFKLNIDFTIIKSQDDSDFKAIFREPDSFEIRYENYFNEPYHYQEISVPIYISVPNKLEFNEHKFIDLEKMVFTNQKIEYFGSKTSLKCNEVNYCEIKLKDLIKSSRAYCYGNKVNLDFQLTIIDFFVKYNNIYIAGRINFDLLPEDDEGNEIRPEGVSLRSINDNLKYKEIYENNPIPFKFQIDFFHQYLITAFGYDRYKNCKDDLFDLEMLSRHQDFQNESKELAIESELIVKIPELYLWHYLSNYSGIPKSRA